MFFNPEQPINAAYPIPKEFVPEKDRPVRFIQSLKASFSMDVTLLGIAMLVRPEQL